MNEGDCKCQCPLSGEQVGRMQAELIYLRSQVETFAEISKGNAEAIITERANHQGYLKGIDIGARIVGYIVLAGLMLAAGKVTGTLELVLKLLKL